MGSIFALAVGWFRSFFVKGIDLIAGGDLDVPSARTAVVAVPGCVIGVVSGAFSASSRSGFAQKYQQRREADRAQRIERALDALPVRYPAELAACGHVRARQAEDALTLIEGSATT